MAMEAQPDDRGTTVMERVRAVHLRMVDAVLGGDGLEGVAALAAGETGGVVAIVVPRLGAAAASGPVADLSACAATSASGRAAARPRSRPGSWPRCRSRPATSSSVRCCCSATTSRRPTRSSSCTSRRWPA